MNWSSGKDAAMACYLLQQNPNFDLRYVLTSMNTVHDRVTMHGLRRSLLEAQLNALQIPARTIELPESPDMESYGKSVREALLTFAEEGIQHAAFGDIFLEDLRQYREEQLSSVGFKAVFPLWNRNTRELLQEFIDLGFEALVLCADADLLGEKFLGRKLDASFLNDLPDGVDPCGENGEFHTFCYAGPIFQTAIQFTEGERVLRTYPDPGGDPNKEKGFWFLDLIPA